MLLAKTSSNPRAEASPRNTSRSAESGMSRRDSMNICWVLSRQPVPPRASSRTEERRPKPAKATVSGAPSSTLAAGVYSSERTRDVVTATTPSLALSMPISARTPGKYTILYGVRERSAGMSAAVAEPPSRTPSRLLLPGRLSDTCGRGPRRGATVPFEAPHPRKGDLALKTAMSGRIMNQTIAEFGLRSDVLFLHGCRVGDE